MCIWVFDNSTSLVGIHLEVPQATLKTWNARQRSNWKWEWIRHIINKS